MEDAKDSGERYPPRENCVRDLIVCRLKRDLGEKIGDKALNPLYAHDKSYGN